MPARAPVSQRRTTVRAPVSATATYDSSAAQRDAVGEGEPVEDDLGLAVGVEPQQPAGAGVLDEVVLPPLDAVPASRSRRTTRCRRRRSRRCCRTPSGRRRRGRRPPRPRRSRCRRGAPPGGRRRPAAGRRGRARGRAGGRRCAATRSIRRPSWPTRQMLPSSVPVNTAPSSGPGWRRRRPRRRSPGTGTTCRDRGLMAPWCPIPPGDPTSGAGGVRGRSRSAADPPGRHRPPDGRLVVRPRAGHPHRDPVPAVGARSR